MSMIETEISSVLAHIRAVQGSINSGVAADIAPRETGETTGFGVMLKQAMTAVNTQQQSADALATKFQSGDPNTSIAEVVVEMQKASVSFQAMAEARNRIVEAYREIMNMSV
jgi:flagellar hook-basal body complex protein FliE